MKKIIVHNDRFHADDVFSVATLKILFNDDIEIIRTRDPEIIKTGDIILDVGNEYSPEENRYDHHQIEGAGKRDNGIPYASFGLIWKHFGKDICKEEEAWSIFDEKIVQPIDAADNGFSICDYKYDIKEYAPDSLVGSLNPTWSEDAKLYDINFLVAVDIAKFIVEREIKKANDSVEGNRISREIYNNTEDKRVLILDNLYPWHSVAKENEELLYVVSPSKVGDKWRIHCVQSSGFVNRKDLPREWAGKRDEELEEVSGVKGAIFCHRNLFVAYASSKESAIQMLNIALEQ